jgi:moderate conductance mechanosensitive channel
MNASASRWAHLAGTHGLRVLAIVVFAFVFIRLLRAGTSRLVELARSQTRAAQMREAHTRTLAGILYSFGAVLIAGLAFLEVLNEFGFEITPIAAIAGLASLSIGFGAQSLVKDLINGFFIIFEDQFVVGDTIRTAGEIGRVEYLTLRRTVIRNPQGALVTLPNGTIGQVANLSRDWSQAFIDITVPSDETVGRALAILEKICGDFRGDMDWSPAIVDGPRVLGVESLALEGTMLRLQVRSAALRQDDVARELRRRIKAAFEQAHIRTANTQPVEMISRAATAG